MAGLSEDGKGSKKVKEIRKDFLQMEDKMMAYKIQDEEYSKKYKWNKEDRKVGRQDVPFAMQTHDEEEMEMQRENFERLEKLKKLAEEDAELARQLQTNEMATLKRRQKSDRHINQEFTTISTTLDFTDAGVDDAELAKLLQEKEMLEQQKYTIKQEIRDQELAIELYNKELRLVAGSRYNPGSGQPIERRSSHNDPLNQGKLGGKVISLKDFRGFEVADGISEEEKRELIRLQDEELAKALQKSEQMKAFKKQMSAGEIERRDAELARLIQQSEKLNLKQHCHTSGSKHDDGGYLVPLCNHNSAIGPRHSTSANSSTFSAGSDRNYNGACPCHSSSTHRSSYSNRSSVSSKTHSGLPSLEGGSIYENLSDPTSGSDKDGRRLDKYSPRSVKK